MPTFFYRAIDLEGKEKSDRMEAISEEEARAKIAETGMMVTSVTLDQPMREGDQEESITPQGIFAPRKKIYSFGKIVTQEHLTTFTRQLATMLESGLPLLRSLEVLIRQEKKSAFREVIVALAENIRTGNNLSEGLEQHPKIFDNLFISMVKAGEAGGILDIVLKRIALFMEKRLKLKKRVLAALFYPLIVMSVAALIVGVLMVVVIPRFQSIYDNLLRGAPLPPLTQGVITISHFLKFNGWILLIVLIAVVFLYKAVRMVPFGARFFDWVYLHLPKIGELVVKVSIARFSRTFGTLLSSGVPLLQALRVTRNVVGNRLIIDALNTVHDGVRDGESIASPLERSKVFPTMVTSMIDVGEETGELAEMLDRIADNYDEDVDNTVAAFTSIIEPIMIVILALIVGIIVIALFLPIIGIMQQLSGG